MLVAANRRRRGAVVLESAMVYPVALLLLFGVLIGGAGVFRYQETAWLAREGARYASVRGTGYAKESGNAAATEAAVRSYLRDQAIAMDPNGLQCTVRWDSSASPLKAEFDEGVTTVTVNTVTVTVTYEWFPELYLVGPIRLSSTSTMPMSY